MIVQPGNRLTFNYRVRILDLTFQSRKTFRHTYGN